MSDTATAVGTTDDMIKALHNRIDALTAMVNDLHAQLATAERERDEARSGVDPVQMFALQEKLTGSNEMVADLQEKLAKQKQDMVDFKARVRDKANEVRKDRDWCLSGTNEVLTDLGIDPINDSWDVTATFTASGTFTVEADSEDDAREQALQFDTWRYNVPSDPYDFAVTIDDIEPVES